MAEQKKTKEQRQMELKLEHCKAVVRKKVKAFEQLDLQYALLESKSDEIKSSSKELKAFLLRIIETEINIYSLSKHLVDLYVQLPTEDDLQKEQESYKSDITKNFDDEISRVESEIKKYKKELSYLDESVFPPDSSPIPEKPKEPEKPDLKKVGLFNKKKITAENEALISTYEEQKANYDTQLAHYYQQIEDRDLRYRKDQESFEQNKQQNRTILIKKISDSQLILEEKIAEKEKKLPDLIAELKPQKLELVFEMLNKEIQEAESMLLQLIQTKRAFYESNIVYRKYHDIGAITTFYEYLESGRCDSLEGNSGAYNIYETEIRSNMIISKLSDIVTSLEKIKENQLYIYSEIKETNSEIRRLGRSMDQMVKSLQSIKADTSSIKNATQKISETTEEIAYNTERTAYYSKKNAVLTNALGYLIAIK